MNTPVSNDNTIELSVVDTVACGTSVTALKRGNMPDIVDDGTVGILVGNSEKMAGAVTKAEQLDGSRCGKRTMVRFITGCMLQDDIPVYEKIIEQTRAEYLRPWGFYEILSEGPGHKVKRITVNSGQRLSYQRHSRRAEHWYVISGKAVVTINENRIELTAGQAVDLPAQTWHRIWNSGSDDLLFIEVQTGDYFGEDDIERLEDDYGRASESVII